MKICFQWLATLILLHWRDVGVAVHRYLVNCTKSINKKYIVSTHSVSYNNGKNHIYVAQTLTNPLLGISRLTDIALGSVLLWLIRCFIIASIKFWAENVPSVGCCPG